MSVEVSASNSTILVKPLLRGHFHQAAFFLALGACSMLIAMNNSGRAMVAALIYSICVLNLFATSAIYHRANWQPQMRTFWRRLDHSAIFLLIAGTMTPIALLALSPDSGRKLLSVVWSVSFLGIAQSIFWPRASKWLTALLSILTGWLAAPLLPELRARLGSIDVWLLVIGGVLYTIGALIYAGKRPDPWPKYFGYHEIFHIFVVIAAALHFIVIARIVT